MDSESLIWLASYPRSGNTFTRILLANYFQGGEEAYDINQLGSFCPADTSYGLWQNHEATFGAPKTVQETWEARPKVLNSYRKSKPPLSFPGLKTHTGNVATFGSKGIDARQSDRVLYIVRHPLDVAISFADFNSMDLDYAITELCTPGAYAQDEGTGALEIRGSWPEHVSSWLVQPSCPVLLLQYEALRTHTAKSLRAILNFLGVPVIEEKVTHAVTASQFDKVREQEISNSFKEASRYSASGTFFRKGESLQWLRLFSPEQAYRLADGCGEMMQRVGYAHPREVFFDGRNAFLTV